MIRAMVWSVVTLLLAADLSHGAEVPQVVRPRTFAARQLAEPEAVFWPAYFWLWNGPLEPAVLRRQLADMAAHDARSVCVVPMPREFRPDSTGNRMDVDYLSAEFFDRVQVAVEQASQLHMHYWLYDEGGWPSGQAAGRVVRQRPDLAARVMKPREGGSWTEQRNGGRPDLLNPETTKTFVDLTHERYQRAVGSHFGSTIQLVFTDEPAVDYVAPGGQVPWTDGAADLFARQFGYPVSDALPGFAAQPGTLSAELRGRRADYFDFWSARMRQAFFEPLRDWSREHRLAHGGHLGGDDETFGSARYGYGHIMRQLRAMDVPGIDIIWRQVFPGRANHHFAKFASSAAHQNGTALALTESFCVYGNGLTPAQMKWLIDFQYVRGLNILVAGCHPLSTQDNLMPGERPHFGPVDPLWDYLPTLHRYVARLGYLLSCGEPVIDTALYLPIRDAWADGGDAPALRLHDALAQGLLERQCDFDCVDDDALADKKALSEPGTIAVGAARYRQIVVGDAQWLDPRGNRQLNAARESGAHVVPVSSGQDITQALQPLAPTVRLVPAASDVRASLRRWPGGGVAYLFNEGSHAFTGRAEIALAGPARQVDLCTGELFPLSTEDGAIHVSLSAGESLVILFGDHPELPVRARHTNVTAEQPLDAGWEAKPLVRYEAGEHDYLQERFERAEFKPLRLDAWTEWIDPDFSGKVLYRCRFKLPSDWHGQRLAIGLGRVDYAARVRVDGQVVGDLLWAPWQIDLPRLEAREEHLLEVEVANTLANELTSQRVRDAWKKQAGPGWPGPYHQRAIEFEQESRSGGLFGPVTLLRLVP